MNEIVLPRQLDLAFQSRPTDIMIGKVMHALEDVDRPILFNLAFDPGWESLRSEFQAKAVKSEKDFGYVDAFMQKNPAQFDVASTEDFVSLMHLMAMESPERLENICVGFNGDIRQWNNFIIDTDKKMLLLFRNLKNCSVFTANMNNSSRLSDFPRFFWFDPIRDGKNPDRNLSPQSEVIARKTKAEMHGYHVKSGASCLKIGLEAKARGAASLVSRINMSERFGLIASPYIANVSAANVAEDTILKTEMVPPTSTRADVTVNIDGSDQIFTRYAALELDAAE